MHVIIRSADFSHVSGGLLTNKGRSVACCYLYHRGSNYPGDSTVIITDDRSAIDMSVRLKGGDCGLVTAGIRPSGSALGARPRASRRFGKRLAYRCLFGDRRGILNEGVILGQVRRAWRPRTNSARRASRS